MMKKTEGDLKIAHVRFWNELYITARKPFTPNIYDFPDVYDAVFHAPIEQIQVEVNSIEGWNLKEFFSRQDLSQDIAEETHYLTVLEKRLDWGTKIVVLYRKGTQICVKSL